VRYDFERLPLVASIKRYPHSRIGPGLGALLLNGFFRAGYGVFFYRYFLAHLNEPRENGSQAFEQALTETQQPAFSLQRKAGHLLILL